MENKVIDITANPIDASRVDNEIVSQVSITEISSAVVTNQIVESTQYNFNIAVNLTGYGEESLPNSSLFFRPDFSAHIVGTSERFSKTLGKVISDQFTRSEQVRILVAKAQTEIISASELVTLVAGFNRSITDTTTAFDGSSISIGKAVVDTYATTDLATKAYNSSKLEQVATSEVFSTLSSFNPQIDDTISITDDVLGLANVDDDQVAEVQKVLTDSGTLAEFFSKLVTKVFTDSTTNSEVTSLLYNKAINETVSKAELVSLDYSKTTVEVLALQELFTTTTTWQRELLEQVNEQDLVTLAYGKQTSELLATTEQTIFSYSKTLLDSITTTDDFYGVANIDDDQIAAFEKVLLDSATLSELVTTETSFYRTLLDTTTAIEAVSSQVSTVYADQTANTEQFVKSLQKSMPQDLLALSGTDLIYLTTARPVSDSFSASDTTTASFGQVFIETTTTSDVFSILNTFGRQINDTIVATDDILGLANVDDDQIATFTKVISDTGTINDLLLSTINYNRDFSDASTNTDALSLLVQPSYLEVVSSTENFLLVANKGINDVGATTELVTLTSTFNRDYTDTYSSLDSATLLVAKVLADATSAIQEVITRSTGKSLVETVTNSETKTANIQNFFQSNFVQTGYVGINLTL